MKLGQVRPEDAEGVSGASLDQNTGKAMGRKAHHGMATAVSCRCQYLEQEADALTGDAGILLVCDLF